MKSNKFTGLLFPILKILNGAIKDEDELGIYKSKFKSIVAYLQQHFIIPSTTSSNKVV